MTPSDHHSSIDENDIVIAVMGPTGSGKSSFINAAAGREVVVVSNDLKSETRAVQSVRCSHPDGRRHIVLVDTPGSNHTTQSDLMIHKTIAKWLAEEYRNSVKLTGLLYLHRISDVRFGGSSLKDLAVFKNLCGDDIMKHVVIVTTMWDELPDQSYGSEREEELLSSFWKGMTDRGMRTCRFGGTRESAWEIIDRLDLDESGLERLPLQIQKEMTEQGLEFHQTAAGKTLVRSLVQLGRELKRGLGKFFRVRDGGAR